jgi:preprotein translocase subunit SecG
MLEYQSKTNKEFFMAKEIKSVRKGVVDMTVLKYVSLAIYAVVCVALIVLTLIQNKDDSGASGTITGSSTNNFYNQNKGKTKEGKIKRLTIILGITFAVLTVVVSIFYIA